MTDLQLAIERVKAYRDLNAKRNMFGDSGRARVANEIITELEGLESGVDGEPNPFVCPKCGYDESKWVTLGTVHLDPETETMSFTRATPASAPVVEPDKSP